MSLSARRIAAAAFLAAGVLVTAAGAARAGDSAERAIIGFSEDGGYFAFEEFGVQDGSGFPYSNIYVVDTGTDRWVPGTPIRERVQNEEAPLSAARQRSRDRAAPVIDRLGIVAEGRLLVSNPATELSAAPHSALFVVDAYMRMSNLRWELMLTELPFPDPPGCENLGPVQGFRLVVRGPQGNDTFRHEDTSIPNSRSCPQSYVLSDVISYPAGETPRVIVVLIGVYSQGFEGPDLRFIALTGKMPS